MLEAWKLDYNKIRKYVGLTGTRNLEYILEVQVCRSSVVNK